MDNAEKQFSSSNFDPEKYVKEISQGCVGGVELLQQRAKIQNIAEATNNELKKNVYHHYALFIETANEISRLQGDMYHLSHLLSEQRSLLSGMTTSSIFVDEEMIADMVDSKEDEEDLVMKRMQTMSELAEKVEGVINLRENSDRYLLHEGELTELDPIENTQLHKLHVFLLTDIILLTTPISTRRSPIRYKLKTIYDVQHMAIVNVKDVKNAFKLLAFPDTRVFQVFSSQAKKEWLDKFEEAKRLKFSAKNRKRGSVCIDQKSPPVCSETTLNPFDEEAKEPDIVENIPDWLLEVAEDLDVLIVERHFEDAYSLIEKTRSFMKETPPTDEALAQDISGKVEARVKVLTQILTKELEISPNKSLQGGLRAARRPVKLLNTLQKSTQACDLFLKLCSNLLKSQLTRVKRESAVVIYVKQLSAVFFTNLCDMAREFQYQAFPDNKPCASAFVVWCVKEVNIFMSGLIREIFVSNVSLPVLSKCVECLHNRGNMLTEYGIDIIYQIDGLLRTPLVRALSETTEKMMENVLKKFSDEKWYMTNLGSKQQADKFVMELKTLGLNGIQSCIKDECHTYLTKNTISFCRLYIQFASNIAFDVPNISYEVEKAMCEVLLSFIRLIVQALLSDKFKNEVYIIQKNGQFFVEQFIPLCEDMYRKFERNGSVKLRQLRNELDDTLKNPK